ncbi:MAG TPA: cytochrome c peroxidase [Kofleriaceae bacterium]
MRGRWISIALFASACSAKSPTAEELGETMFMDPNLSHPAGQACADCHAPHAAFRDPESDHTTSMGVMPGRFGSRNAPSLMYARFIPPLHYNGGQWYGGLFHDGRASSLEDQVAGPLLNPIEMNNPDKATVVDAVRTSSYAGEFRDVFGASSLDDTDTAFAHITEALAAYERSPVFAPFSSKYDRYLAHEATLTPPEQRGLAIFEDPARGNCASCHPPPMFTNYSYANLGVPKYANNKFLANDPVFNPDGFAFVDHGLMTTVADPAQDGKFRVPTLRDVARTAPYGHNGYFENLPYMLEFHATRDGLSSSGAWAGPEIAANVDQRVGHLRLSAKDLEDLRAFLLTLDDAR